jgi:hypothetical protein
MAPGHSENGLFTDVDASGTYVHRGATALVHGLAVHDALRQQGLWSGLVLVPAALGLHTHGLLTRYS